LVPVVEVTCSTSNGPRWRVIFLTLAIVSCSGTGATVPSVVPGSGPPLALSDLTGSWANDTVTLQVNDAGDFLVLPTGDPDEVAPLLDGFVARDEEDLIFVTGVGGECPGQSGVYGAAIDAGILTLSLVEDPCPVRVAWFEPPLARVGD
jgi:hypothetical protein